MRIVRCATAALLLACASLLAADTLSVETQTSVAAVMARVSYAHAVVGVCVRDGESGEVVWQHNGDTTLVTASCMKAVTVANAFHYLGADRTFETVIGTDGKITDGGLDGNLYIVGGGDPSLGAAKVAGALAQDELLATWVQAVQARGITSVKGKVIGVKNLFTRTNAVPDDWSWDDIGNYYAAAPCGLSIAENMYRLVLAPGAVLGSQGQIVRTEPDMPEITWENNLRTGAAGTGDRASIYFAGPSRNKLSGTIPLDAETFAIRGAIPNPHLTTARLLNTALNNAGIVTDGVAPMDIAPEVLMEIHKTVSPPLKDIAYRLCRESNNFFSEMLLLHIGEAQQTTDTDTRREALRAETKYLQSLGVDTQPFQLADGSGLSRFNGVTGTGITQMLFGIQSEPWFGDYLKALPHLGMPDSDLRDRKSQPDIIGRVYAKTGLIRKVRGHVGYLDAASGKRFVFSILINGYLAPYTEVDKDVDEMLAALYREL